MPEVSVIIPVYNNEKFVEKCVRSVMGQSFGDLEIIVVDDGSTDQSGSILKRLAKEDKRIRLITQENKGVSEARNLGLDAAMGRYLTFVDGDDYIGRDYIRRLYHFAEQHKTQMLICGFTYVDERGNILDRVIPEDYRRLEREEWALRISAVWSHFYRREIWETYGIRFRAGERGEDMPVSLFFSAVCRRIAVLDHAGYFYVRHPSSGVHTLRGLKYDRLPYEALEETIQKIRTVGCANGRDFYELFVLRILAVCFFRFVPGASRDKKRELCGYIVRILNTYFPRYYKNKRARLFSDTQLPFLQKAAVKAFILLVRTRGIYLAAMLMR